jgi:hypothetical protein
VGLGDVIRGWLDERVLATIHELQDGLEVVLTTQAEAFALIKNQLVQLQETTSSALAEVASDVQRILGQLDAEQNVDPAQLGDVLGKIQSLQTQLGSLDPVPDPEPEPASLDAETDEPPPETVEG